MVVEGEGKPKIEEQVESKGESLINKNSKPTEGQPPATAESGDKDKSDKQKIKSLGSPDQLKKDPAKMKAL